MSQIENKKENEFKDGVSVLSDPTSRRNFIKGLGVSMAVAGLSACAPIRKPEQKIIPYAKQPEYLVEGKAVFYATSFHTGSNVEGLLVETHEGRPTKIEGNPDHSSSLGATSSFAQASIYDLYDPDRNAIVRHKTKETSLSSFKEWLQNLKLSKNSNIGILIEKNPSQSFHSLLNDVQSTFPNTHIAEHNVHSTQSSESGLKLISNQRIHPDYKFEKASIILSLESDFLDGNIYPNSYAKGFSKRL